MKKILLLFYFIVATVSAEIFEVGHFNEINSYISKDTLLILDIDDTLLIPTQMLGCDEWFQCRLKEHEADGMSQRDSLEKSLAEWEAVRHISEMKIVEPGTDTLLKQLQEKGFHIMGLTTQGLALTTRTKQQLLDNKIDLSLATPFKNDHYTCLDGQGILYRGGILFTSGRSKGESLFRLLEANGYVPSKIVFLNDKESHLADIEEVANKKDCPYIGLRYAYADKHKACFRPEIADLQFHRSSFARLLSDEEADTLLKEKLPPF